MVLVGLEVEVAVAAEVEDDRLRATLLAAQGLVDHGRMAWAGSGAGRMPSVRANCTAASKILDCG